MLIIIACIVVALASMVQTAVGFGFALLAVPLLLLIDTAMVPAPVVMVAVAQVVVVTWLQREHLRWDLLKLAIIGRVPGTLVAMALMSYFGELGIRVFVAVAVLAAVALSLFKVSAQPNGRNHLIAGFFAGISGTASGIGGPPMALLYQNQHGDFIRANLAAFFLIGGIFSLIGMGVVGYVTLQSWLYGALFLPSTFIGVWLGMKVKDKLKPAFMRPTILILCSASAVAVIVTTFLSFDGWQ